MLGFQREQTSGPPLLQVVFGRQAATRDLAGQSIPIGGPEYSRLRPSLFLTVHREPPDLQGMGSLIWVVSLLAVPAYTAEEDLLARHPKSRRGPSGDIARTRVLPCGCVFYGDPLPTFTCRDFSALETAMRLAEALAAAVPDDPFFRRLALVSHDAFRRHLGGHRADSPVPDPLALSEAEAPAELTQSLSPRRASAAKAVETCTT
jgi:hypothetical protein